MEVQQNSADRRPHILQMTDELKVNTVITVKDFLREVEQLVTEKKKENIDAVVYYCEKNMKN